MDHAKEFKKESILVSRTLWSHVSPSTKQRRRGLWSPAPEAQVTWFDLFLVSVYTRVLLG